MRKSRFEGNFILMVKFRPLITIQLLLFSFSRKNVLKSKKKDADEAL